MSELREVPRHGLAARLDAEAAASLLGVRLRLRARPVAVAPYEPPLTGGVVAEPPPKG